MADTAALVGTLADAAPMWLYLAILAIAVLEGFVVTTFATNGTLAFVAVGALIVRGYVEAVPALLCIFAGTVAGDGATFALSARVQCFGFIARRLEGLGPYRAPMAYTPYRFVVFAHMTPYLKGVVALLASGVVPTAVWFRAELLGALCGTLFFTGIGAGGALVYRNTNRLTPVSTTMGIGLLVALVVGWVRMARPCRRPPSAHRVDRNRMRLFFFFLYYPLWRPIRCAEAALRMLPTRSKHPDLATAFPDARSGDIFLVRLHAPAPWGKWAHAALAVSGTEFVHAFDKRISVHRFAGLPVRYTIAHLRVRCDEETARRAGAAAWKTIGRRVSIVARPDDTRKFSCTSLVCHVYAAVGIDLRPKHIGAGRAVPDDLFHSEHIQLVRTVFTEGAATLGFRYRGHHAAR